MDNTCTIDKMQVVNLQTGFFYKLENYGERLKHYVFSLGHEM
jgi:hypothetical protein